MTPLAYYGLSFNPFDKQAVREKDRFLSADLKEMTSRLDYLKDSRGIGVFTASPGMGKSFALRCFAAGLNPGLYHMEYICLSTVSVMEFYRQFCSVLGLEDRGGKPGMFKAIQEQVYSLYKEKRKPLLLAVDEAQYLSTGILNDIKMLMNHGYDSLNCFTLVLCGEPHLNSILRRPVHEPSASASRCIIISWGLAIPRSQSISRIRSHVPVDPGPFWTMPRSLPCTAIQTGTRA